MKISFRNDYAEGCHPNILHALAQGNLSQQEAYGMDDYSQLATKHILQKCNASGAKVHYVTGGTQANLLVISSILKPYEAVISAHTGHIYTNEAGAIEATGHKVISIPSAEGKLTVLELQSVLELHSRPPHQVRPKLVYLSNSTELGTIYKKEELEELAAFCRDNSLFLFMDGARLGSALRAKDNDLGIEDVARLTDVFYIGGTKNGALMGEAIVITNAALQQDFEFNMKQKGALLSKGRLLGIQFLELFKDDLYFDLAQHANDQAMRLKEAFIRINSTFLVDTCTNQIFPILRQEQINRLSQKFDFYVWHKIDENHAAVRIICSWATESASIDLFIEEILGLG